MNDIKYMQLAIDIAKKTQTQTSPNPPVGAVIVKNNTILAIGIHRKSGEDHAEINALNVLSQEESHDACIYLTLEPCNHFGKTPPCTSTIIEKKIKRVVIACIDKNPLVNGSGIEKLRLAGIEVVTGVLEAQAEILYSKFFYAITNHKPFITLKVAMSLDAKIATSSKESKWITNQCSREDAHKYRENHDAILVGINTVIYDNPLLTARINGISKQPTKIILDTKLRTPITANIIVDTNTPTIIITGSEIEASKKQQFANHNVKIISLNTPTINIHDIMPILYDLGINSILVEGGQNIHNTFIQQKLFNQLVIYLSPILIGGENALNFFTGSGFKHINDAVKLQINQINNINGDIKIVANQIF